MKTTTTSNESELWGIYHLDREYARELGDPLRTVVRAATKAQAEQEAIRLGFDAPWAHPVTRQEAEAAQWCPKVNHVRNRGSERTNGQARLNRHQALTPRLDSQDAADCPTPHELQVAVEVLQKLQRRIDHQAAESVMRQPDNSFGDRNAEGIERHTLKRTQNIEAIVAQLRSWTEAISRNVQVRNRNGHSV